MNMIRSGRARRRMGATMLAVSCSLAIALAIFVETAGASEREAYLKSMVGTVKVRKGESPIWKDGRPSMVLTEKDAVRTFVESQAEIMTAEGTVLRLDENTTLEIAVLKDFGGGGQTSSIKILNGAVLANVEKLINTGSTFTFETPTAVAAIRGTTVGFNVSGDQTVIKVYEGVVLVSPKGAKSSVSVGANQMATIAKGQKSVTAVQLAEPEAKVQAADTTHRDTVKSPVDTSKAKTAPATDSSATLPLKLNMLGPQDNATVKSGALVTVFGNVSVSAAKVVVAGNQVTVSPTGDFKTSITAQQNPGDYDVSIEASYGTQSQTIVKHYSVVPSADLFLKLTSPAQGQILGQPLVSVAGSTIPGAEVTASGIKCLVSGDGTFTGQVPIPDEETQFDLEVVATYNGKTVTIVRRITYSAAISLSVVSPQSGQVVTSTSVQVTGSVLPSTAELTVNDTKIPLLSNGKFSGFVPIPDEEGQVSLAFEVAAGGVTKTQTQMITYKRPLDNIRPQISPAFLPTTSKTSSLSFTVTDATPDDEITFYKFVDGAQETETGSPNSSFLLDLVEGTHTYIVYAEDKARNRSNTVTGSVSYLFRKLAIQMLKPIGTDVLRIPPGHPTGSGLSDDFAPKYPVQFQIFNVPDNEVSLIKQVTVKNLSTGETEKQTSLFDLRLEVEISLARGDNRIEVDVLDINNNTTVASGMVQLR